ncbi:MAG: GntR family transcriptional regulator [Planctomycetota bacterium]|jgi:GntR family transcriptional repressor for pyruvate dehydrogenase complex|nr:GntR family transcriptional regulator [Planctomycetota bacterium]
MGPTHGKYAMIPIKRTDIFQTVIQRLKGFLDNGDLKPGDRLPSERTLSESLGVSRTSVRQGLKVLESSGRIETRVGSGTYVADASKRRGQELLELLQKGVNETFLTQLIEARTALEKMIFEAFLNVANRKNVTVLRKLVEQNAEEFLNPADESQAGLDMTFERKICELTGNPVLMILQRQVHDLWVAAWRQFGFVPERLAVLHAEHLGILDCLSRGEYEMATELMVAHVDKSVTDS